jgi:hypothetical protein
MQSPYNPLIEDYTKIFYIIDEEDVPSVESKMILKGPRSMRKVDGMSFMFQRSHHVSIILIPRCSFMRT